MGQIANKMVVEYTAKAINKFVKKFVKSKYAKELDSYITRIEMNMSNNYKDNAQANLKEFEEAYNKYASEGFLSESEKEVYESKLGIYKERLKGYTHKDQKPYWT